MQIKVLSYGMLSKNNGGKVTTGLTEVMWGIANGINGIAFNDIEVVFLTLSKRSKKEIIENTIVYGFNVASIMIYMILNVFIVIRCLINTVKIVMDYKLDLLRVFVKMVFLEYGYKILKPDIVHIHEIEMYIIFNETSFCKKVKNVLTIHGITGQDKNIKNYTNNARMESKISALNTYVIVFVSSYLMRQWIGHYGTVSGNAKIIINGVDASIYNYKGKCHKEDKIRIAVIGTIIPRKGQERVLRSLKECVLADKIELYLVGECTDVEYSKYINKLIDQVKSKVYVLGYLSQEKISELLNKIDYMLLPSSSEGFGLVYIESIMCGTPVIIPEDLPIVKEKNVLTQYNSILLKDCSEESILRALNSIDKYVFDKLIVSKSCDKMTKENYVHSYNDLFLWLYEK